MQASDALNATLLLTSIGVIVSACEHLSILQEFGAGGLYTPLLHMESKVYRSIARKRIARKLYSPATLSTCLAIQLILACVVIFFAALRSAHFHPFILWLFVIVSAGVNWRRRVGGDGASQMTMLVLTASALDFTFQPIGHCCRAAAFFITAQACLSYIVAGIAKVISGLWRSGDALRNVLDTNTFGSIWLSGILRTHPSLAQFLNWSVVTGEVAFSLVLFAPKPVRLGMLGAGVAFHLVNAVAMGLNDFLWAFLATYPCIYWVATQISPS